MDDAGAAGGLLLIPLLGPGAAVLGWWARIPGSNRRILLLLFCDACAAVQLLLLAMHVLLQQLLEFTGMGKGTSPVLFCSSACLAAIPVSMQPSGTASTLASSRAIAQR